MTEEDDGKPSGELEAALEACEEQVDQLKWENTLLREASHSFGALAERLRATLESERRHGGDRRAAPRGTDRRQVAATRGSDDHR